MLNKAYGLMFALATARAAVGDTLFVANSDHTVTQLSLIRTRTSARLEAVGATDECGINPSWLDLDRQTGTLFCLNEAYTLSNAGSLAALTSDLTVPAILGNSSADVGPVHSNIYAPNRIALAHYIGSAVSVFDFSDVEKLHQIQSFHYTLREPGPVPSRQDVPHPHQILLDPTGKYLVTPDLGADLLRLYSVSSNARLIELDPVSTIPGSGPRHGVFVQSSEKTFYYILGELGNSLTGYEVTYRGDTLEFEEIYRESAFATPYGDGAGVIAPAEIFAPEPNHLVVSIRNDSRSTYEGQPSDTLITYEVHPRSGALTLLGTSPAAGSFPRGIAINANGTLVAVATQRTGRLAIFERDVESGLISNSSLATWETAERVASDGYSLVHVIWDEQ